MARKRSRPYGSDVTPVDSLDALFGSSRPAAELVRTSDIKTRTQPRRYFDAEKLEQLVQSVKQHGILEPLLVRPLPGQSVRASSWRKALPSRCPCGTCRGSRSGTGTQ
jgi:hypothetical protein